MPKTMSTWYCSSRRTTASPQLGVRVREALLDSGPSGVTSAMQGAYRLRWVSDVALIERAEELLAAQGERVAALLPEGSQPFDAHTHLGLDEDGHSLSVEQHLRLMDEAGVSAANVFALNEPDREPAYRAPNDRILRWTAEAPDRLFPFVRLSLDEDPLGEAVRCLDRGARGIKLHPRAQ